MTVSLFKEKGWRRISAYNTVGVCVFASVLIALLAWSASVSGGLSSNSIIFQGRCRKSQLVNLWLHLLLNVCSTGILASSNFFMQILNAPTRVDVDRAHSKYEVLSIGVSSMRNFLYIDGHKPFLWLLFLLSSFPLHVFFNGAIFSTKYLGGSWHLTVASEGFLAGAPYVGPGAVLWAAGAADMNSSYGGTVSLGEYQDSKSTTARAIRYAAENGKRWKRLEVSDCLSQYLYCSPRVDLGDVILVVASNSSADYLMDSKDNSLGWNSSRVMANLTEDQEYRWKQYGVDVRSANSLWFAANCSTSGIKNENSCHQSCLGAFGGNNASAVYSAKSAASIPSNYTFNFFSVVNRTSQPNISNIYGHLYWPDVYPEDTATLDLQYCLAEPVLDVCKVGVSNTILCIVVICICVKALGCIIVLFLLPKSRRDPLVVSGDAIASFIRNPDKTTIGRCTLDKHKVKTEITVKYVTVAGPTQWVSKPRRWLTAIRTKIWARNYAIFILVTCVACSSFIIVQVASPMRGLHNLTDHLSNGMSALGNTPDSLLSSVFSVSVPQILLSFTYMVYNSTFTHLSVEREWNSYSLGYRPLRVTDPKGQQRSTYRLQLPYRYSIPLISVSILLHWVCSNAYYIIALEGGYYILDIDTHYSSGIPKPPSDKTGFSPEGFIIIGYSTFMVLWLFVAVVVLPFVPLGLGYRTMPGRMPPGGSNSFVISAACHVPNPTPTSDGNIAVIRSRSNSQQGDSTAGTLSANGTSNHEDVEPGPDEHLNMEPYLVQASREPLRWGVTKTSSLSCEEFINLAADDAGHLSFGTRDHHVCDPVDGFFYS
ncbi:hypothetical protein QQS21_000601 [Conoideocrella luteorostrata]|uniref:DUF6536 domain-containing protein n=1 Tax=Conoideocrella luteorostrata TaxID=1105319 RepID=A0AAJ0CYS1_9HYPO|nr:hypothetical protein QQS21_000601 [Conoideocrella luteorostrata]